jgi:hypothetical protein
VPQQLLNRPDVVIGLLLLKCYPNENFSLNVILENGEKRLLDMKPYLDFGVFKKLREYEKFKRARVASDTIEWDEGVDLDPEFVYEKSKPIKDA